MKLKLFFLFRLAAILFGASAVVLQGTPIESILGSLMAISVMAAAITWFKLE